MDRFSAQEIAAAIIYLNGNEPMDYIDLTELVKDTRLTRLGDEGGTPERTLNVDLNRPYKGGGNNCYLFQNLGDSCYNLRDKNIISQVRRLKSAVEAVRKLYITKDNKIIQKITTNIEEEILNKYPSLDKSKDIKDCIDKLKYYMEKIKGKINDIEKHIETI
jgi:hypothetical protein